MATEDGSAAPIYDNPKSPKEKRVAKKGDIKVMDGEEFESNGNLKAKPGDSEYPDDADGSSSWERIDTKGEMWRRKKKPKPEVPTS